jgi:hypothetical protein
MSLKEKLEAAERRRSVSEYWRRYVFAAGYSTDDFSALTTEETHELGGAICRRIFPRLLASGPLKAVYVEEDTLDYLAKMTDAERATLRAEINFKCTF